MSDPVTNAEVEDVLSSIRRLVSEEKRPVPTAKAVPQQDRLVLTPSLRIEEDGPAELEPFSSARDVFEEDQSDVASFDDSPATSDSHEAEHAHDAPFELPIEAMTRAQSQDNVAEDDYATDPYNFDDDSDVDGESDASATVTSASTTAAPWPAIVSEDPEKEARNSAQQKAPASSSKAAALSAKIEALETAIGGIKDDFEPDEPGMDAYSGSAAPAMEWEDDIANGAQTEQDLVDVQDQNEPETGAQSFEDELTFRHTADDEPDVPSEEELTAEITKETLQDTRERIEEAVVAAANPIQDDEDQPFAFASDAPVIDEAVLRDMVGDIVRAELQGALGERITRNVRKLVRREIHRALTTQDLE